MPPPTPLDVIQDPLLAPIDPLIGRTVAIIGYGNQGRAHALNLRDSGVQVVVGARPGGRGAANAQADGFDPLPIDQAAHQGDLVVLSLPDEAVADIWSAHIAPAIPAHSTIGFLHGLAIHFKLIQPPPTNGVVMVAPKGPGATLRQRYVDGLGISCLLAVKQSGERNDAEPLALAWANGIGCARSAIIRTSFAHETETDLFGEQAVLCGGMTAMIRAAFEILVEAGYPPELAYIECCHEVKQVADLMYERGLAGMMDAISNTAEFGAHAAGPPLIDDHVRQRMRQLLADVQSGAFVTKLVDDYQAGFPWFEKQRQALRDDSIEQAGRTAREFMSARGVEDAATGNGQRATGNRHGHETIVILHATKP